MRTNRKVMWWELAKPYDFANFIVNKRTSKGVWMKRGLLYILTGLILCAILGFSIQNGTMSNDLSMGLSERFFTWMVHHDLDVYPVRDLNMIFRKIAHFASYSLLTLTVGLLLWRRRKYFLSLLGAPCISVLVALVDENIQKNNPGRTGMVMDVMIDGLGIGFGLLVLVLAMVAASIVYRETW